MTVNWIEKTRLESGDLLAGTFLNLGASTSAEIAADLGFDWLLFDFEHGSGSWDALRSMLVACRGSRAAPIVRIRSVDPDAVKFALDSGAAGVMFPFVNSVDDARRAIQASKYPPVGTRGVAGIIRATSYGKDWNDYFTQANQRTLVVVQIETTAGVQSAEEIAQLDDVDVLFVGPLDLSVSLGAPGSFENAKFNEALEKVLAACRRNGKTAGILSKPGFVKQHLEMGFRFFALGSDTGAVVSGLQANLNEIRS